MANDTRHRQISYKRLGICNMIKIILSIFLYIESMEFVKLHGTSVCFGVF